MAGQILASLDDINANLPSDDSEGFVVVADDANTAKIQISVARVVRGYLSRIIDNALLLTWVTPATTPELVREIAGKLIAAQLYFNKVSSQSTVIEPNSFAQKLYDEAIAILQQIILGEITLPNVVAVSTETLTTLDFFPVDSTDRSFSKSMLLY